jgi:hypothetical protein
MPDTQPPVDGDEPADDHDEVLGSVDSLMARLRPALPVNAPVPLRPAQPAPPPAVVTPPHAASPVRASPSAGEIPILTDVVSLGPVSVRAAPPPPPDVPALPLPDVDDLEREVYRRLGDRLDHEVGTLLERRVMPELAVSLDHALAQVAAEIKGSLRQLVRETIEETLHQQVRNLRLPLAADASEGDSADPGAVPPDR